MTKPSVVICLFLSPLLAFVGCGRVETQTEAPDREIAQPDRPLVTVQKPESIAPPEDSVREPAIAEPEENIPAATDASARAAAVSDTEGQRPVETVPTETPEPNAPDLPVPPAETQISETVPTERLVAAEPNQAEASEPETFEPNEPTPLVPAEQVTEIAVPPEQPQTSAAQADALASFYERYAEVLNEYVLKNGRVDYGRLRRRRLRLKQLLGEPDELDPNAYQSWPEDEKLAFWINAYNLKMLEIIARNYPIQSSWWLRLTWPPSDIRHIGGIWSDYRFIVMDEEFTLGDVERRVFHRIFGDPRAYLAIAYGCRSGPRLRRTPYRGDKLDSQLDEQVRTFLADGGGFRIDRDKQVVYLSALFKPSWRGKDFVGRYAMQKKFKDRPPETRAVLNFLTRYVSQDDVYFLEVENYTIAYTNFDWRIDDRGRAD
ncbi:MAG: DUF547 domain-containing protein [Planctomycetota bacterium]|jgi:hypothetical protein